MKAKEGGKLNLPEEGLLGSLLLDWCMGMGEWWWWWGGSFWARFQGCGPIQRRDWRLLDLFRPSGQLQRCRRAALEDLNPHIATAKQHATWRENESREAKPYTLIIRVYRRLKRRDRQRMIAPEREAEWLVGTKSHSNGKKKKVEIAAGSLQMPRWQYEVFSCRLKEGLKKKWRLGEEEDERAT